MIRNCSLEEIFDGKIYDYNDMVKADTMGCAGCSACCHNMGNSIVLDPLDFYRIRCATGLSAQELLTGYVELNMVDGVILPNLKMREDSAACPFLNEAERCVIHSSRPGICRLFPLGRYYENGDFHYILQTDECAMKNRSKIKVKKWLDIENYEEYKQFVLSWHKLIRYVGEKTATATDEAAAKALLMQVLNVFYLQNEAESEENFLKNYYAKEDIIYGGEN